MLLVSCFFLSEENVQPYYPESTKVKELWTKRFEDQCIRVELHVQTPPTGDLLLQKHQNFSNQIPIISTSRKHRDCYVK